MCKRERRTALKGMRRGAVGWATVFLLCFITQPRPTNKSLDSLVL